MRNKEFTRKILSFYHSLGLQIYYEALNFVGFLSFSSYYCRSIFVPFVIIKRNKHVRKVQGKIHSGNFALSTKICFLLNLKKKTFANIYLDETIFYLQIFLFSFPHYASAFFAIFDLKKKAFVIHLLNKEFLGLSSRVNAKMLIKSRPWSEKVVLDIFMMFIFFFMGFSARHRERKKNHTPFNGKLFQFSFFSEQTHKMLMQVRRLFTRMSVIIDLIYDSPLFNIRKFWWCSNLLFSFPFMCTF